MCLDKRIDLISRDHDLLQIYSFNLYRRGEGEEIVLL